MNAVEAAGSAGDLPITNTSQVPMEVSGWRIPGTKSIRMEDLSGVAVCPESFNYLFNPLHGEASGVAIQWGKRIVYDRRLFHAVPITHRVASESRRSKPRTRP
jgi:hypothetical protein